MVEHKYIPTENKKPVEIVQELKGDEYQIPSFEEFMKDYQADENLNYSDLNSGSVGEVGGYGPCTSDYCSCSNYELRQQLRSLKSQAKGDIDDFWEKFKEYDGKWENYKSNVNNYFSDRSKAGATRTVGSYVVDAIPVPFLSAIHNSIQDSVDGAFETKFENDRSYYYNRAVNKYNEIKDWYYRIRSRYC